MSSKAFSVLPGVVRKHSDVPPSIMRGRAWTVPLWDLRDEEYLREKEQEIGKRFFDRGFRQLSYSDEEHTFDPNALDRMFGADAESAWADDRWTRIVGVDLSGKRRKGTVIAVLAAFMGQRVVIEVRCGAWDGTEIGRQIVAVDAAHNPLKIVVEDNGAQALMCDYLSTLRAPGEPDTLAAKIRPFTTTARNKHDEVGGIRGMATEIAADRWRWPGGEIDHSDCARAECSRCRGEEEFRLHPDHPTTDIVMALWFARELAREMADSVGGSFVSTATRDEMRTSGDAQW